MTSNTTVCTVASIVLTELKIFHSRQCCGSRHVRVPERQFLTSNRVEIRSTLRILGISRKCHVVACQKCGESLNVHMAVEEDDRYVNYDLNPTKMRPLQHSTKYFR